MKALKHRTNQDTSIPHGVTNPSKPVKALKPSYRVWNSSAPYVGHKPLKACEGSETGDDATVDLCLRVTNPSKPVKALKLEEWGLLNDVQLSQTPQSL